MNSDEITSTTYLQELYNSTQGNTETQVSMHDIGLGIGVEKTEAGRIAEVLMLQGLIELKTLAGGISITDEGLISLGMSPTNSSDNADAYNLSPGPVVTDSDRQIIERIIASVKNAITENALSYTVTEQTIFDLKIVELHLLSPFPKTAVCREIFGSLAKSFSENDRIMNDSELAGFMTDNPSPSTE
ncbi:MAG: hypothetical protein COA36_12885 [Desulfotalea sp.]|nr:MAG: hypothetical protein COA36_12885 [Desulfotalea sp.]